jgi:hypothetical protein
LIIGAVISLVCGVLSFLGTVIAGIVILWLHLGRIVVQGPGAAREFEFPLYASCGIAFLLALLAVAATSAGIIAIVTLLIAEVKKDLHEEGISSVTGRARASSHDSGTPVSGAIACR